MDDIRKGIYRSRVLTHIGRLSQEVGPEVALRKDLIRATGLSGDEMDEVLRDLKERGLVETGPTINDTYVRLTPQTTQQP